MVAFKSLLAVAMLLFAPVHVFAGQDAVGEQNISVEYDRMEKPDFGRGIVAFDAEDYQRALHHFLPLAIEGNAEAQFRLAQMYLLGQGVPKDACATTIWADKAARQNHPYAAALMAHAYYGGDGVRFNPEMAYRWMVYAHKLGNTRVGEDDIDFMAGEITPEQREAIDLDMKTWDPTKLPPADIYYFDDSILKPSAFFGLIAIRLRSASCR